MCHAADCRAQSLNAETVVGLKLIHYLQVSSQHAEVTRKDNGEYFLKDLGSEKGTWLKGKKLKAHQEIKLHPEDPIYFGSDVPECSFKVKLAHHTVEEQLQSYLQKIDRVQSELGESTEESHKELAILE